VTTTQLGIATVGLSETEVRHVRSLVVMAIKARAVRHAWMVRDAAQADLIVIHAASWAEVDRSRTVNEQGLPLVAVLAAESEAVPRGGTKLQTPVTLEQLTVLLGTVERRHDKAHPPPKGDTSAPGASTILRDPGRNPLVRLAALIREGAHAQKNSAWRVFGLGRHPVVIATAAKQFHYADEIDTLAVGASSTIALEPVALEQIPDLPAERPLALLQWQVGLLTSDIGLLPWINPAAAFKLRRYPHLIALRQVSVHRRIAAVLSLPCLNVEHICAMTGIDQRIVTGFVNAASLCGYLTEVEATAVPKAVPATAPAPRRSLFASFRKALGISSP
jgi:hypothetical protein